MVDAICLLIDDPEADLNAIMEHIKGPDFPTGGVIMGHAGIRAAYATGRGKITVRARTEIEEHGNRFRIVITEIPYQVNKLNLVKSIIDLVDEKLSLIHISEPTRQAEISYAVFCLKKKKKRKRKR